MDNLTLLTGDCLDTLRTLESESVQMCVTSPPYWNLRNYGMDNQLGAESDYKTYVDNLVYIFDEVKRILKPDGTFWLNIGDTYHKQQLLGIPWRVAFALQDQGWILRSDIIWQKLNTMPECVKNRPSKSYEHLFLFAKNVKYHYDADPLREPCKEISIKRLKYKFNSTNPDRQDFGQNSFKTMNPLGKNKRDVWTLAAANFKGGHFAAYPPKLVEPCILAGSRLGDVVLDPFSGSGTTGLVALQNNRKYIGIDLNPEYNAIALKRIKETLNI